MGSKIVLIRSIGEDFTTINIEINDVLQRPGHLCGLFGAGDNHIA
jgi:hypothetical protein